MTVGVRDAVHSQWEATYMTVEVRDAVHSQ